MSSLPLSVEIFDIRANLRYLIYYNSPFLTSDGRQFQQKMPWPRCKNQHLFFHNLKFNLKIVPADSELRIPEMLAKEQVFIHLNRLSTVFHRISSCQNLFRCPDTLCPRTFFVRALAVLLQLPGIFPCPHRSELASLLNHFFHCIWKFTGSFTVHDDNPHSKLACITLVSRFTEYNGRHHFNFLTCIFIIPLSSFRKCCT